MRTAMVKKNNVPQNRLVVINKTNKVGWQLNQYSTSGRMFIVMGAIALWLIAIGLLLYANFTPPTATFNFSFRIVYTIPFWTYSDLLSQDVDIQLLPTATSVIFTIFCIVVISVLFMTIRYNIRGISLKKHTYVEFKWLKIMFVTMIIIAFFLLAMAWLGYFQKLEAPISNEFLISFFWKSVSDGIEGPLASLSIAGYCMLAMFVLSFIFWIYSLVRMCLILKRNYKFEITKDYK